MIKIQLNRSVWEYNPSKPLGPPGGFGRVYAGKGPGNPDVAIKVLHLSATDAAHREMKIAEELADKLLKHVVPILDSGMDASSDSYCVVMTRAIESLVDHIARSGPVDDPEAVDILLDIAKGLKEVDWIVHRDLKPANVLLQDGVWKIADFGIARFVEESTSLNTLKDCLTPPFAAPEQWTSKRAMSSTDIYALGCIAHYLMTGHGPFPGPTTEDFRHQHLYDDPPSLTSANPRFRSLVSIMLRKVPETRPSINRVIEILGQLIDARNNREPQKGYDALASAGADAAEAELAREAKMMKFISNREKRERVAEAANKILQEIFDTLSSRIMEHAHTARVAPARLDQRRIVLGNASIETFIISQKEPIPLAAFNRSGWDVISGAKISVHQPRSKEYVWAANLWFTNLGKGDEYRWYEVSYYFSGFGQVTSYKYEPFAVREIQEADLAASNIISPINIARRPTPIDDENVEEFCDKWAELLAKAYKGQLRHPSHLPMD